MGNESVVVYYSPYGGKATAIVRGADPDYEDSLRANGVPFKKWAGAATDIPKSGDAYAVDRVYVVNGQIEVR